jgi:hypothetical protein
VKKYSVGRAQRNPLFLAQERAWVSLRSTHATNYHRHPEVATEEPTAPILVRSRGFPDFRNSANMHSRRMTETPRALETGDKFGDIDNLLVASRDQLVHPDTETTPSVSNSRAAALDARETSFGAERWQFVQPRRFDFRPATLIDRSSSLSARLTCSSCD